MKKGANVTDQKMIAYLAEQGGTVKQISKKLRIKESVVNSFMPDNANESVKKTRARNKKSRAEHDAIMSAKKTPAIMPDAPRANSE